MSATRVVDFLNSHHVQYATVVHPEAYSANQVASAAHIPVKEVAKTVMIKVDGDLAMAVLPASRDVDLEVLEAVLDAHRVRLAGESEFRRRFPDCETGAMPPFGNLYGMKVYVDESLTKDEQITFEAGSHHEAIRLAYADFEKLVRPTVLRFSTAHIEWRREADRESPDH
ncbi:MAG TPA: YbaK/EbsC family protein [Bryobacteraceae bacterium]|nr:YbaK/EbsC family protein [Bryobacteraceae bacterium]